MSGLFGELHRTAQALNAQSQGVYTAGRNMANVNNPAYARQRVQIGDRGTVQTPLGPQSLGVEALALQNVRDALLDSQVIRETASKNSLEKQAEAFANGQLALGQQIDRQSDSSFINDASSTGSQGVGVALDSFLNAFSSLATNPRSTAEQQALYQTAQSLVSRMHMTDSRLANVQRDLTAQTEADVLRVNELLGTISNLNSQIGRFEVGVPGSALDLRDQRQARLEELAQYIDVSVENVPDSGGQIRILSQDASATEVVLLDQAKPFFPVAFDGTNVTGGSSGAVLALTGGRIQGSLAARDGGIADLRTGLNTLAAQVVTAVNAAYNPAGASTNFFNAAGTTAATIALDPAVTPTTIRATATANPGANELALAVADLATTTFATSAGDLINGTFGSSYLTLVSNIANATNSAESRLEDQSTLYNAVLQRRDSVSGVSLDEEMTDLIKYQRAFDASARMMRAIDEMLKTVVNGLVG